MVVSSIFSNFAPEQIDEIMVFYRKLFHSESLSLNEGIVYSTLLSKSLMTSEHFNTDGTFSVDLVKTYIQNNVEDGTGEFIDYYPFSSDEILMEEVELSRNTVSRIMDKLEDIGYVANNLIYCPPELLDGGFLRIPPNTKLKGQQRLFYATLLEMSKTHRGSIDTWAYKLADIYGIKESNVYYIIHQLKKAHLIERQGNKLIIKEPESKERKPRVKKDKPARRKKKRESPDSLDFEQIDLG